MIALKKTEKLIGFILIVVYLPEVGDFPRLLSDHDYNRHHDHHPYHQHHMYDHHRYCCITGGELIKAGDVPGDGEDHHRHNVDAAGEGVHPGLHKYQDIFVVFFSSKHI